jgi:bacillithiol biosynthesis deacetylase BshB1
MTPPLDGAPFHAAAFGPHPDDVELFCGGTVARLVRLGYRTAIVDLSEGELSSRGTLETRRGEAQAAARVLGVQRRINLGLPDGGLENSPANRRAVIEALRALRPRMLLLPHTDDRHPDHEQAAVLIRAAAFQAALAKVETGQPPHRVDGLLHYMCHHPFAPSLIVDVSEDQGTKERAIACYRTQFATEVLDGATAGPRPETPGPQTPISTPRFIEQLLARSRWFGSQAGVSHGEPFLTRLPPLVTDPLGLFPGPAGPGEEA